MNRLSIGTNVSPPMATTLVGALVDGKVNFMAVAWISRVNLKPPMISVSIKKERHTRKGIIENGTFSVCLPNIDMKKVTDYCGVTSGAKIDKSQLFELFYGELKTAPMIVQCPLNMECRLVRTIELPTHGIFVGEIVGAYCQERFLTDGEPDMQKINPLLLTMEDRRYWGLGQQIGNAWKDGLGYHPKQ